MRMNLAVLAVAGATMLAGLGCGEGDMPAEEAASALMTVTEMTQLPDGTWKTTSTRTIPRGPSFRQNVGDGVELQQDPLFVTPCSSNWSVALFRNTGLTGDALCLNPNGTNVRFNFAWIWPAKSVYTITPLYLFNANNSVVFLSCESGVGRYSLSLPSPATSAQEASSNSGACHF
jgi:hypothetical protein